MVPIPYLSSLRPLNAAIADPKQKEVLDQGVRSAGFLPDMYANMANAPALLSTYLHGYGLFRSESGFSPPEQEVVFLAVSKANGCNYCTAAHSMIAERKSGLADEVLQAIRHDRPVPDARLAALHPLATEMVATQGRSKPATVDDFLAAGFEDRHILYIVLAIAVKTLSNYSNHAFATSIDEVFAPYRVA